MSLRLGIAGAGSIAAVHAEAAARAGMEVAAVCDHHRDRASALAAKHPGAVAAGSLDELLAVDGLDAVTVAVPNDLHKDFAIAALRSGRDVLLEKPMGLNTAECDAIIEAAGQADRFVQLGFVCRYAPAARAARMLVAEGKLGSIYHVNATLYRRRGIPGLGRWFTTRARSGGGVLMDLGVHLVDLALFLTGFPHATRASAVRTSVFGSPPGQYHYQEMWSGPPDPQGAFDVEDGLQALLRFDSGITLHLGVSWAANIPEAALGDGVVVLGDQGGCSIDLWGNRLTVASEQDGQLTDSSFPLPECDAWPTAWQAQYEAFADAVRTRRPPEASAGQGRLVQALIDSLYRSAQEGCEVEVMSDE